METKQITLIRYNNYYNRQIKSVINRRSTDFSAETRYQTGGIQFNPNDGVTTTLILNVPDLMIEQCDYLLVAEDADGQDPDRIESGWYILDATRTVTGQYKLNLLNDTIGNNLDKTKKLPAYIERGYLSEEDPMIFNDEGLSFNQIKVDEVPLSDKTNTPWIVGYIANKITNPADEQIDPLDDKVVAATKPIPYDYRIGSWSEFRYGEYINATGDNRYKGTPTINKYGLWTYLNNDRGDIIYAKRGIALNTEYKYTSAFGHRVIQNPNEFIKEDALQSFAKQLRSYRLNGKSVDTLLVEQIGGGNESSDQYLTRYNNKIMYVTGENKYYTLNIKKEKATTYNKTISSSQSSNLLTAFDAIVGKMISEDDIKMGFAPAATAGTNYTVNYTFSYYTITATEVDTSVASMKFYAGRNKLQDAPYTMFAMPYKDVTVVNGQYQAFVSNGAVCKSIATQIAQDLGGNGKFLYDLQILPYCPYPEMIDAEGHINIGITGKQNTYDYGYIRVGNNPDDTSKTRLGIILYPTSSTFSLQIPYSYRIDNHKIQSQTEMMRICSPNYSGVFEFNPAKNRGIDYFQVDCTYKPFVPYIHVAPNFNTNGLYGGSYSDQRGLICGGDFSLPVVTDAWTNYELQNKNYKNIFDREIQSMETNRDIQREQQLWGIGFGTVQAGVAGVATGAQIGGGVGATIGGAVSTLASLTAGVEDYRLSEKAYNESIDFKKDVYNMQLDNIKALPTCLTNVGCLSANFKYFPFLEVYKCTDVEKIALEKKIEWESMAVGRIGIIGDYVNSQYNYVRGKPLRLSELGDNHIVNQIVSELSKGVYIE